MQLGTVSKLCCLARGDRKLRVLAQHHSRTDIDFWIGIYIPYATFYPELYIVARPSMLVLLIERLLTKLVTRKRDYKSAPVKSITKKLNDLWGTSLPVSVRYTNNINGEHLLRNQLSAASRGTLQKRHVGANWKR